MALINKTKVEDGFTPVSSTELFPPPEKMNKDELNKIIEEKKKGIRIKTIESSSKIIRNADMFTLLAIAFSMMLAGVFLGFAVSYYLPGFSGGLWPLLLSLVPICLGVIGFIVNQLLPEGDFKKQFQEDFKTISDTINKTADRVRETLNIRR